MTVPVSVIAIDGPVAAGKTVVGRKLAQQLGFRYLDTGVMYRAITWLSLQREIPAEDEEALGQLARDNPIRLQGQDSDKVLIGGAQVGPELRDPSVDRRVSLVSQVSQVRRALVQQQRALAKEGKIVLVGRDIGTVVLPGADLKIFVTASLEERARRRWRDQLAQRTETNYQQVLEETRSRDELDSHRADSPLKPAEDAWQMSTEGLSVDQVVNLILQRAQELPKA
ncbi:MAG: (d)CMP kinase [Chloroflexi bacterium]|nr:(d)CMP kinase [Chloroflexota bacterium]MCI0795072.1 (d)CMP kinase [Chloroflexota bacterium]MCI0799458.1 (d)CMP kinase [Chloroflexota bacterium]MCI0825218.1 (d)CMP kinase [Chloroflexota bacterium]MCI0860123.1 (d)CMP kinase [Chloroflexota bacterium]